MSVTMLPGGELYQALETGVLDATEFSLPTVDEQLGFFQVAKNYYLPGWHQPSTNQFLYVNLDVWNGLEDTTKATIEMACMAGNAMAIAKAEALQGAVLKRFEENGVQVHVYSDDMLKGFYDDHEEGDGAQVGRERDVRQGLRLDDGLPGGTEPVEGEGLPSARLDEQERL